MNKRGIIRFRFRVPAEFDPTGWDALTILGLEELAKIARVAKISECEYVFIYAPSDVFLSLVLGAMKDRIDHFLTDCEAVEMPLLIDPIREEDS